MNDSTGSKQRDWRGLAVNLGLAVVSFLAVAVTVELAMRWILLRNLNPFEPVPEIGYRLKRSFQGAYPRTAVRTDAHGRRVPDGFDGDASGRLLFIGDSVTFGFGVLAEESFPSLYAERVGQQADATNAAVPGYNLGQALAALRDNVRLAVPELVVYGVVVNDIGDADDPVAYVDIDPHASRSRGGGLLSRSVLVAYVQRRWDRLSGRLFTPDQEGASPRAPASVIDDFDTQLDAAVVAAFDRQWRQLEEYQQRSGVPVFAVVFPFREQVEVTGAGAMQRFMSRRCQSSPVVCLDPLGMLERHRDEGLFNGESSYHFSPHGHRLIADWLLAQIPG